MEETKYTYCRICEPNCGLVATVVDGKLSDVKGDKEHPISKGYICQRGKATVELHKDPDRIKYPYRQVNGKWERVGWNEALDDIGSRLKSIREKYGRHSIGIYFGNPLAFDYNFSVYMQVAMMSMGTRNVYSAGTQDCNNKFAAGERVYGSPVIHPVPDIEKIDFLIILGSNPVVSKMSFMSLTRPEERLKAIQKRGGRVVIIDPRYTETARHLEDHIFIKPDSDIFFLLSMIHVIISEKLYDQDAVKNHTKGFDDLAKLAAQYPPQKSAEITGIEPSVVESLARDFARAKNKGMHSSLGVNLGSFGSLGYWLVISLNAITGCLDKSGSLIFCDGFVDAAKLYKMSTKGKKPPVSRVGGCPSTLGTLPAGVLADEILTPGKDQIKALLVISGNPMMTVPDTDKLEKAFKSLELLVSMDLFINETGGLSEYVLPSKDFYEHWDFAITGLMFNPVRYINYTDAVVKAEGERKELWIIFHEVLRAAGYPMLGSRVISPSLRFWDVVGRLLGREEPLSIRPKFMLKIMLLMGGVSFRKLKRSRQGMLVKEHKPGNFFKKRILTKDKKLDLAPPEFIAEADTLRKFFETEKNYKGFKLINQRQRHTHNSWFHNVKSFVEKEKTNRISINPGDAKRLNISNDDLVIVKTDTNSITIPALVTDDLMPGVVSIPHGWGHNKPSGFTVAQQYPGVNVNKIMASGPAALEKFAGMAKLTGVHVTLSKA